MIQSNGKWARWREKTSTSFVKALYEDDPRQKHSFIQEMVFWEHSNLKPSKKSEHLKKYEVSEFCHSKLQFAIMPNIISLSVQIIQMSGNCYSHKSKNNEKYFIYNKANRSQTLTCITVWHWDKGQELSHAAGSITNNWSLPQAMKKSPFLPAVQPLPHPGTRPAGSQWGSSGTWPSLSQWLARVPRTDHYNLLLILC